MKQTSLISTFYFSSTSFYFPLSLPWQTKRPGELCNFPSCVSQRFWSIVKAIAVSTKSTDLNGWPPILPPPPKKKFFWRNRRHFHVSNNMQWHINNCCINYYKNLAIANRSRVSCAHNTWGESIVTPSLWNLGQVSIKIIENGAVR